MATPLARESNLHCKLDSWLHWAAIRRIFWVGQYVDNGNSDYKGSQVFTAYAKSYHLYLPALSIQALRNCAQITCTY